LKAEPKWNSFNVSQTILKQFVNIYGLPSDHGR